MDTEGKHSPLSVLEVSDPKICILAHLMSPMEPIEPILESPLSHPIIKQRIAASELLHEVIFLFFILFYFKKKGLGFIIMRLTNKL